MRRWIMKGWHIALIATAIVGAGGVAVAMEVRARKAEEAKDAAERARAEIASRESLIRQQTDEAARVSAEAARALAAARSAAAAVEAGREAIMAQAREAGQNEAERAAARASVARETNDLAEATARHETNLRQISAYRGTLLALGGSRMRFAQRIERYPEVLRYSISEDGLIETPYTGPIEAADTGSPRASAVIASRALSEGPAGDYAASLGFQRGGGERFPNVRVVLPAEMEARRQAFMVAESMTETRRMLESTTADDTALQSRISEIRQRISHYNLIVSGGVPRARADSFQSIG
jgi:hypothetical protein